MTPIPSIQYMYRLYFFVKLYLMEYIKDLVISDTNILIYSAVSLSEYFCVVVCHLIMAYYVGHSGGDLFLEDTITPHKGSVVHLKHIISGRRLEKITRFMSYKNIAVHEFNDPFFQWRHIQ